MPTSIETIKKNQSFSLPIWLLKRLKIESANRDLSQSEILTRALCREFGIKLQVHQLEETTALVPVEGVAAATTASQALDGGERHPNDVQEIDLWEGATQAEREWEEILVYKLTEQYGENYTPQQRQNYVNAWWDKISKDNPGSTYQDWWRPLEERLAERRAQEVES